jgi:hypothetical protein
MMSKRLRFIKNRYLMKPLNFSSIITKFLLEKIT